MDNFNPTVKVPAVFVKGGYGDVMHLADPNNFTYVCNGQDVSGGRLSQKLKCSKKKTLKCQARALTVTDEDTGIVWIKVLTGGHTHQPSLRDQVIYILIITKSHKYLPDK